MKPEFEYDLGGYSLGGRTVVRILARGATPARAIVGGQGLEAVTHTVGRGDQYRHILANFGASEPGSPERALEDWVKRIGGDPVALLRVLDTFADTPSAALARIAVPTLVLTGAGDGHNGTAEALASALPNGRYTMVPGSHTGAMSTPELLTAITDFLDGCHRQEDSA
jgi:pimeloyl-ACP methyl ester carboxylesterase